MELNKENLKNKQKELEKNFEDIKTKFILQEERVKTEQKRYQEYADILAKLQAQYSLIEELLKEDTSKEETSKEA